MTTEVHKVRTNYSPYFIDYFDTLDAVDTTVSDIIKSSTKYDFVVGIVRGGLVFATLLSYRLSIPLLTVNLSFRDTPQLNSISDDTLQLLKNSNVLYVDDIVDSGKTIETIRTWIEKPIDVACLVYNIDQPQPVKYHHFEIDRSTDKNWFEFWWDINE